MDVTIVKAAVIGFMQSGQLFTSVNIANHIKTVKKVWVKNSEVADWLRQNFDDVEREITSGYVSTVINVGSGLQANLYHPSTVDPNTYTDTNLAAITPDEFKQMHGFDPFVAQQATSVAAVAVTPAASPAPAQPKIAPTSLSQSPSVIKEKERIRIPTRIVLAIGLKPGDFVKTDKILIAKNIPTRLRVHKDGRLSIPRKCVRFGNRPVGDSPVKVFVRDNKIGFERARSR